MVTAEPVIQIPYATDGPAVTDTVTSDRLVDPLLTKIPVLPPQAVPVDLAVTWERSVEEVRMAVPPIVLCTVRFLSSAL